MNAPASFPWAEVVSNAVWICGLAVILAALGWHDYKRRERASDVAVGLPPDVDADFSLRLESPGTPSDAAAGFSLRQDKRNLKVTAGTEAQSLTKPVLIGLIMVAGGLALSIRRAFPAAAFATAGFALIFIFAKKMLRRA